MSNRTEMVFYVRLVEGRKKKTRVDLTGRVLSFTFDDEERKADKFSLVVDNWDLKNFDTEVWAKGKTLEMSWGYAGNMAPARLMVIKSVKGSTTLKIDGVDKAFAMDTVPRDRTFVNQTRSDMIRTIAAENGYADELAHIEDTEEVVEGATQANTTDAAFIRKLADKEGFEFYVDFDGFHFHQRNMKQAPYREYTWYNDSRGTIISFDIENDVTVRTFAAVVKGRDLKKKKDFGALVITDQQLAAAPTEDQAGLKAMREMINLARAGAIDAVDKAREKRDNFSRTVRDGFARAEANEIIHGTRDQLGEIGFLREPGEMEAAKAEIERLDAELSERNAIKNAEGKLRRKRQLTVKMNMKLVGEPQLIAKTVLRINGIGERLSGNYYSKSVKHTYGPSGYTQDVKLIRDGRNRASESRLFEGGGGGGGGGGGAVVKFVDCLPAVKQVVAIHNEVARLWQSVKRSGVLRDDTTIGGSSWLAKGPTFESKFSEIAGLVASVSSSPNATKLQKISFESSDLHGGINTFRGSTALGVAPIAQLSAKLDMLSSAAINAAGTCNAELTAALGDKAINDARVANTERNVQIGNRKGVEQSYRKDDGSIGYTVFWGESVRESVPKK